ncbi:type III pantothenate kinase [bacterium]|nr:type III pantothenate kinase [candidate division CSSED10-310 bacterium]
MRLVVDIGNTNISVGILENGQVLHCWRLATHMRRTRDEYSLLLKGLIHDVGLIPDCIDSASMCCVVPPLQDPMRQSLNIIANNRCLIVEPGVRIGMKIRYDLTTHVGSDRIVNAYAAIQRYGSPIMMIDFGTATTFCVVDSEGVYRGGAIFPGINTVSEALYQSASLLPRVAFKQPPRVVGESTVHSIQSGLFFGYLDLTQGMIHRVCSEYPDIDTVVATGGLGRIIHEHCPLITHYEPHLTLYGLSELYDLNNGDTAAAIW